MDQRIYQEINKEIGQEKIKNLHKPIFIFDLFAVIGIPTIFLLNIYYLGIYPISFIWLMVLIFQAFLIQIFQLAAHELFTHRKVLGNNLSYYVSFIYFLPLFLSPTLYRKFHMLHHRYSNTADDPEEFKQDLDKRWKRFLFLTFIGQLLAPSRIFYAGKPEEFKQPITFDPKSDIGKKIKFEYKIVLVFILSVITLLWFFPNYVIWGYLVPFLGIVPFLYSIRLIIEHADTDTQNPFSIATNYKTNILTRALFFYDSGDCHLVHHIFPNIPFYKIQKMNLAIEPVLQKHGVRQHRSLLKLLYCYYVLNLPHRSVYPE
ncbi:fatty acid desaturase family protein [Legionella erythra]|uniref:Fatty acid desaturase n=1 Tax=Legionella erythra TaxID=448 RepID=A0A0W0TGP2_LEGER|nr:fatty acid desaturase [Legionella erythra]KTC94726.1 Fatty acid desaturase [Legionella erythra]